ncbi:extracellular solute-binding protein [Bosea caraganae]|uniref:Extracellular solute-binding protein n=1 Tax=Bosea caraganae TaxID=2763117 RepID=A0A370KZ15_9HYPH|nr:extracellular solute-binding protein [Bosea caraganae]RDJ20233.1 extracellular solute-binding protein [Bosea caraganae]RDJ21155.1 extracellular solute-binding protein [Bosea caraganae]
MTKLHQPSRRALLAGTALALPVLAMPALVRAQAKSLNIISHRVHRNVLTGEGGKGGDIIGEWSKATGAGVNWATFDVAPLHERLLREASLSETSFDLGFVVNTLAVPRVLRLMEPLDALQKSDPIEDFAGVAPGMVKALSVDSSIRGIPFRHATTGLHVNEAILAERKVATPKTIEEMIEVAKATTFTNAAGVPVSGFAMEGVSYVNMVTLSLAWGAPFISEDLKVLPNEAGMLKTFEVFRDLYAARALPRNFATLKQDEVITQMQAGRAAMCHFAFGRYFAFNDPQKSQFPGKISAIAPPASRDLGTGAIVGTTEFWSFVIPKNSRNKELAWSLVKAMTAKEAVIRGALNGNGPIRASAYEDQRVKDAVPYAAAEAQVLAVARPPLPAFDRAVEAGDALAQAVQAVALGQVTPEQGLADLKRRVEPMVKS